MYPSPEACLSHETALDIYGISDINPKPNPCHTAPPDTWLRRSVSC